MKKLLFLTVLPLLSSCAKVQYTWSDHNRLKDYEEKIQFYSSPDKYLHLTYQNDSNDISVKKGKILANYTDTSLGFSVPPKTRGQKTENKGDTLFIKFHKTDPRLVPFRPAGTNPNDHFVLNIWQNNYQVQKPGSIFMDIYGRYWQNPPSLETVCGPTFVPLKEGDDGTKNYHPDTSIELWVRKIQKKRLLRKEVVANGVKVK
jgi:hypothetical protein